MAILKYRLQQRDHLGVYRNMYRSGVSWGPWHTIAKFDLLNADEAEAKFKQISGKGLRQTRLLLGKTVILISK